MKKLVAESLLELFGPGYISDLASGNTSLKGDTKFKHDTKRPFPPESDEEKAKFDQSDEEDDERGVKAINTLKNWREENAPDASPAPFIFKGGAPKPSPRTIYGSHVPLPKSEAPAGEYYPRKGTAPYSVIKFFEKNAGKKFSTHELFKSVGDSAAVQHGLEYLLKKGLLQMVHEKNPNSGRMANLYSLSTGTQSAEGSTKSTEGPASGPKPKGTEVLLDSRDVYEDGALYDNGDGTFTWITDGDEGEDLINVPKEKLSKVVNIKADELSGGDESGGKSKDSQIPYVELKGKPHGYKTYALLKAISDSPDGFSRTQIQKFLVDGTHGQGTWDKAEGTSKIFNYKGEGDPTTRKANPYRGYWAMNLSQNGGFLSQYLTKANPEMVKRKSQAFGAGFGGDSRRHEIAMTRKGKWILSSAGKATLKKYEAKFGDL